MHPLKTAAIAAAAALLFGCSIMPASTPRPTGAGAPGAESDARSMDAYKNAVAQHILAGNADAVFSGQLPPMLPAIVVVNIGIDADGRLSKAVVQRSRDNEASRVALASLRRVAPFPKPARLLRAGSRVLEFSETFLFNADYKFQLRTLAGPQ